MPRTKKNRGVVPDGEVTGAPKIEKKDENIMDTNNSSIVSKRSVEKLYYTGQKEYFRYFVRKFQRRSPLINRGYWFRMRAIEKTVSAFLTQANGKTKVVVNLGCGYDPLPFQFLGNYSDQCHDAIFVDVDYPPLVQKKVKVVTETEALMELVPDLKPTQSTVGLIADSQKYKILGCDLRDIPLLDKTIRSIADVDNTSLAFLFVAEVSVAYMEKDAANAVFQWAASLNDSQFCLLEQHLPDGPNHPFAQTMLRHFKKLSSPLNAIGTLDDMRERFLSAGWRKDALDIQSLWSLWSDNEFLPVNERQALDPIEPFDEWEDFALFASHYFLLRASNHPKRDGVSKFVSTNDKREQVKTEAIPCDAKSLDGLHDARRFASASTITQNTVIHTGGNGTQERLRSVATCSNKDDNQHVKINDIPLALACHTVSFLESSGELLLVGGRTSPDKASKKCWISKNGEWTETFDLPEGRYRHCAISVHSSKTVPNGVLVFGGKASSGTILAESLFFDIAKGWIPVYIKDSPKPNPRFGACMASRRIDSCRGLLIGGMGVENAIIDECWKWKLSFCEGSLVLDFELNLEIDAIQSSDCSESPNISLLARFGAQLVDTDAGWLLIGGVRAAQLLNHDQEVINLTSGSTLEDTIGKRPLLIGHSAQAVDGGVMILGGGATCFSFGSFWSQDFYIQLNNSIDVHDWKACDGHEKQKSTEKKVLPSHVHSTNTSSTKQRQHESDTHVPCITFTDDFDFESVLRTSTPVILRNVDLGNCTSKWTNDYLVSAIGPDRPVVIHDSPTPNMNFHTKNFSYKTVPFSEFLDSASSGSHTYLRSLSSLDPSSAPTSLQQDFPSLAPDFILPPQLSYISNHMHSSPLRISGPVNMWLHYDVMANILCQIRGTKQLLLFPPGEINHLHIPPGASSSTKDIFSESEMFRGAKMWIADLQDGDVLFIPSLWCHAAQPKDGLSVAVNVFFRDDRLQTAYAAGRDVYGNRDLAAYERGRRDLQKIVKGFEDLPGDVRRFYMDRLVQEFKTLGKSS